MPLHLVKAHGFGFVRDRLVGSLILSCPRFRRIPPGVEGGGWVVSRVPDILSKPAAHSKEQLSMKTTSPEKKGRVIVYMTRMFFFGPL